VARWGKGKKEGEGLQKSISSLTTEGGTPASHSNDWDGGQKGEKRTSPKTLIKRRGCYHACPRRRGNPAQEAEATIQKTQKKKGTKQIGGG